MKAGVTLCAVMKAMWGYFLGTHQWHLSPYITYWWFTIKNINQSTKYRIEFWSSCGVILPLLPSVYLSLYLKEKEILMYPLWTMKRMSVKALIKTCLTPEVNRFLSVLSTLVNCVSEINCCQQEGVSTNTIWFNLNYSEDKWGGDEGNHFIICNMWKYTKKMSSFYFINNLRTILSS